jgi:hypothetical protein
VRKRWSLDRVGRDAWFALVEWSEAVSQYGEETRRLMIYTLHEERSERCIQAVKR